MVVLSGFSRALCALICLGAMGAAQAQVEITDPPATHHFGNIPLHATYAAQYFSVFNKGSAPVTLGMVSVDADGVAVCMAIGCPVLAPQDFVVSDGVGCSGATLQPDTGCSTLIGFVPTAVGERVARLVVPVVGGAAATRVLAGKGVVQPLECVLDWAQEQLPAILSTPTPTFMASPYYARCYASGALCLGADLAVPTFAPASLYVYRNGALESLGLLSDWAARAKCGS